MGGKFSASKEGYYLFAGDYSAKGKRKENQDVTFLTLNAAPKLKANKCSHEESPAIFAVFDGHGGVHCADYISSSLPPYLRNHEQYPADIPTAIRESFHKIDQEYLVEAEKKGFQDGSTALFAVLYKDILYVANLGDSRGLMVQSKKEIVVLSNEHFPSNPEEEARIVKCGGSVNKGRIHGNKLAVSRAFGDPKYKNMEALDQSMVICDPEIREFKITRNTRFLIFASDGLWGAMSSEEVVSTVKESAKKAFVMMKEKMDPSQEIYLCCMKLVEKALEKGGKDNISVVLVFIQHKKHQETEKESEL